MTHRILVTFNQVPYISVFLNKLRCDSIPCHIELYSPNVSELCIVSKGSATEAKALNKLIAKIAVSCGATAIKEFSKCRNSKSKPQPTTSKTLTVSSTL